MDAQDGDFCGRMFAECIHPVFASSKRRPAAIAESKRKSSAGRKKAEKVDEKAQIHVGARMVIKRQKAAAGPLRNVPRQRSPYRRCEHLLELSYNASRALRRGPGKSNTSH